MKVFYHSSHSFSLKGLDFQHEVYPISEMSVKLLRLVYQLRAQQSDAIIGIFFPLLSSQTFSSITLSLMLTNEHPEKSLK